MARSPGAAGVSGRLVPGSRRRGGHEVVGELGQVGVDVGRRRRPRALACVAVQLKPAGRVRAPRTACRASATWPKRRRPGAPGTSSTTRSTIASSRVSSSLAGRDRAELGERVGPELAPEHRGRPEQVAAAPGHAPPDARSPSCTPGGMFDRPLGLRRRTTSPTNSGLPAVRVVDRLHRSAASARRLRRELDVLRHVGLAQPDQGDAAHVRLAGELGQGLVQRDAEGRDRRRGRRTRSAAGWRRSRGPRMEQQQRGLVGGVQVVEHEHARTLLRPLGQELASTASKSRNRAASGSRFGDTRAWSSSISKSGYLGRGGPAPRASTPGAPPASQQRPVRTVRPAGARLGHQLLAQPALPHAGLAGHQHQPPAPCERVAPAPLRAPPAPARAPRSRPARTPPSPAHRSSCGSWRRIASCSSRSSRPGSIPSSSTSVAPGVRERVERLGLAPGAVQRQHQLAAKPLPQRAPADQVAQLGAPAPPRARARGPAAMRSS